MRGAFRRAAAAMLAAFAVFLLSGCSELSGLDAQTLMSPPRTTADREAIYRLLQGEGDAPVTLVYPKNGEHRSAVISRDLDGDGTAEAAGFYAPPEATGLAMQILRKDGNGDWVSLGVVSSAANQVDKVFFGDLTGDGAEEIAVGWGNPQTATAGVSVYGVEDGAVREFFSAPVPYSEMLLTDFDEDGVGELFVLEAAVTPPQGEEGAEPVPPLGSLYRFDGANPFVAGTVPLDLSVTRYSSAVFARLDATRRAAVIDGLRADGHMITQIVGTDQNNTLVAPLSNLPAESPNPTDRAALAAVVARDMDGDGCIEIPTAEIGARWDKEPVDSTGYIVTWNRYVFRSGALTPRVRSVINSSENYCVRLPDLPVRDQFWACSNDTVSRTATFYTYRGNGNLREDLFSVTVLTDESWEKKKDALTEREFLLSAVAGRVYVMTVLSEDITGEEELAALQGGFSILNE